MQPAVKILSKPKAPEPVVSTLLSDSDSESDVNPKEPLFDREKEAEILLKHANLKRAESKSDLLKAIEPAPENEYLEMEPINVYYASSGPTQYHIPVFIGGKLLKGLADTGASHTVISADMIPLIESLGIKIWPTNRTARVVAKDIILPIKGVASIPMTVGEAPNDFEWTGEVMILPNSSQQIILSREQLKQMGANLELPFERIRIDDPYRGEIIIPFKKTEPPRRTTIDVEGIPINLVDIVSYPVYPQLFDAVKKDLDEELVKWQKSFSEMYQPSIGPDVEVFVVETKAMIDTKGDWDLFMEELQTMFADSPGCCEFYRHHIYVDKDEPPIKQRYYDVNPVKLAKIDEQLQALLQKEWIRPSESPWSSPVVLVDKKNGKHRLCVDYRKVNARIKKNAYPTPFIHGILDSLLDSQFVSTVDLWQGYHQIVLDEESKPITAFTVPRRGLYEFNRLPFGLTEAPAAFQALMERILKPYLHKICHVYLDDIIIVGKTYEEHKENIRKVLQALRDAGLRISWEKSKFLMSHVQYLGFVVGQGRISVSEEKVKAVEEFPPPTSKKQVRSFLGLCGWYRRLIPHFADLTAPLTMLLKKKQRWQWGKAQDRAFQKLKKALVTYPIVHCPDYDYPFFVATDASDVGIGGYLYQMVNNEERVIAYCSRVLNPAERNYSVTERECLAVLYSLNIFRSYLEGLKFTVYTDHASLVWLQKLDKPTGRLARWILRLSQFDCVILHRKGSLMNVPDALSRAPYNTEQVSLNCIEFISAQKDFSSTKDKAYEALRKKILEFPDAYPAFKVAENIIFKLVRDLTSGQQKWKIYVPEDFRDELVSNMHSHPMSGHLGVKKTLARVAADHYWPNMSTDVEYVVTSCSECQRFKPSNRTPAGEMQGFIPRMRPLTAYSMDLVGPLPTSTKGNKYILTVLDLCSKYLIAIPLRAATAKHVTAALRKDVICIYGVPQLLVSDNGTQFKCKLFKEVCERHKIRHNFIVPYTPRSNNVERYHATIKNSLAIYAQEDHRTWDKYLPYVVFALNTSKSETTGFTPASLVFGREPNNLFNLADDLAKGPVGEFDPELYLEELTEKSAKAMRKALTKIRKTKFAQSQKYNLRRRQITFTPGDFVWRKNYPQSSKIDFVAAKLAPKYLGPFVVAGMESPTRVKLNSVSGADAGIWHLDQIKPFIGGKPECDNRAVDEKANENLENSEIVNV